MAFGNLNWNWTLFKLTLVKYKGELTFSLSEAPFPPELFQHCAMSQFQFTRLVNKQLVSCTETEQEQFLFQIKLN